MLSYLLIFVLGSVSFLSDAYNRSAFNSLSTSSLPVYAIAGILFFRSTPNIFQTNDRDPPKMSGTFELVIPAVSSLIPVSTTKDIVLYRTPELAIFEPIPFRDYTPVQFVVDRFPKDLIVYQTPALVVYEPIAFRDYTPVQVIIDSAPQVPTTKDVILFKVFELIVFEPALVRDYTVAQLLLVASPKDLVVFKAFELALYRPIPFRDYAPAQFILSTTNDISQDLIVYKTPELAVFELIPFRDYCPARFLESQSFEDRTTNIVVYRPEAFELVVARSIPFRDYMPAFFAKHASYQVMITALPFREAWLAGVPSNTTDLIVYQPNVVDRSSTIPTRVGNLAITQARVHPLLNLCSAFTHLDGTFAGDIAMWNTLDSIWRCVVLVIITVHVLALVYDDRHWRRATWSERWLESLKAKQR